MRRLAPDPEHFVEDPESAEGWSGRGTFENLKGGGDAVMIVVVGNVGGQRPSGEKRHLMPIGGKRLAHLYHVDAVGGAGGDG